MNIEQRVSIGKQVREHLDFIGEQPQQFWDAFHDEMKRRELIHTLQQPKEEELSIHQVHIFEDVLMPFGLYQRTKIKDIPYEYLCNLFDPSPFMKKLKKYLQYCLKYRHRS